MKRLITLALLATILSSCSASWNLRRAIMKDPSVLVPKEIVLRDTVYTQAIAVRDSFYLNQVDTILLEKDKYWTRIVRVRDSIYVDGGCESDTIFLERTVYVPEVNYIKKEKKFPWLWLIISILGSILIWEAFRRRG